MLTRPGWTCLWGGVALLTLARLMGVGEFYVFGAVALGLVAVAVLYVRLTRLDLEIDRTVHPARVHVGRASRVDLAIRNVRNHDTPVLRLRDTVTGTPGAEVMVPPLARGETSVATYRLPTDRRGIIGVGPLRVVVVDPFGLAQASTVASPLVEVTVFPAVDDVTPVPVTAGSDPVAGIVRPQAFGRTGDDFYALRPYVVGDDLRRIHWPSTARHDELQVRQQEQPWQGRTTVVLDVRRAAHDAASFEAAVSAAASVVAANGTRRDHMRLVTTDGDDSGFGTGPAHAQALLEQLAVVEASGHASLRWTLEHLTKDAHGALVLVLGDTVRDELSVMARLRQCYGQVIVVHVDLSAGTSRPAGRGSTTAPTVTVTADTPFRAAWNQVLAPSRRATVLPGGRR